MLMIYVCNSVIAPELYFVGKSIKTPFFRFQRGCEQMGHYPLNPKFLKKKNFFYSKTLINFKNSQKISLSQDP